VRERVREIDRGRESSGQQTSVGSLEANSGAIRCMMSELVRCRRRGLS
jgi:hypothetical protein